MSKPLVLSDFLAGVLEAHGAVLAELRILLGSDEILLNALDSLPRAELVESGRSGFSTWKTWWIAPASDQLPAATIPSPHEILESAANSSKLSEMLEAYLWDYPVYRVYIESHLALNSGLGEGNGLKLAESVVTAASEWIRLFPIRADLRVNAQDSSHRIWIRFRSKIVRESGNSPLKSIN